MRRRPTDDGTVWAGTVLGVARFQGSRWVGGDTEGDPLNLDANEPLADVSAITTGPGGAVWAVAGGELVRFHDGAWTTVASEAMPGPGATALAVGRRSLWVGSTRGLANFERGAVRPGSGS